MFIIRNTVVFFLSLFLTLGAWAQQGVDPDSNAVNADVVLVAGATGGVGRHVIRQLTDQGYTVRAMTRDKERAIANIGDGYDWIEADVRDLDSLVKAMEGVTKVICTIGATDRSGPNSPEFVDFGGVKNLVDAAQKTRVDQFVLVSSRNVEDGGFFAFFMNFMFGDLLKWKFEGEKYLRASGIDYTIIRPGGLSNDAGGELGILFGQGEDLPGRLIAREDVAAVNVAAIQDPDARNKTVEIVNTEDSQPDAWRSVFAELKLDE